MFVKIKILFEIVYYYILSIKAVKNANFYDINETVEYMQSTKKSLIRIIMIPEIKTDKTTRIS